MSKRIAIFGAGAAGSYLGAFLTREGHDITLIDMWGEHVDAMNANGLRASGSQGDFHYTRKCRSPRGRMAASAQLRYYLPRHEVLRHRMVKPLHKATPLP